MFTAAAMNHSGMKIFAPSAAVWPKNLAPSTKSAARARPPRMMMALRMSLAEAVGTVIVNHADRLHVRIADGRADELEAALEQILAQRIGLRRLHRDLVAAINPRPAADEAPDVGVEAAELFLHGEERLCVGDAALELEAIAYDAFISHQGRYFLR